MPRRFSEDSHYRTRALQAYQILIGAASSRQILTYGILSERMGDYGGGRGDILSHPLGCVMRWCEANGLPALTCLVVDGQTGLPSSGLTTVSGNEFAAEQERVFGTKWMEIFPPTLDELANPKSS